MRSSAVCSIPNVIWGHKDESLRTIQACNSCNLLAHLCWNFFLPKKGWVAVDDDSFYLWGLRKICDKLHVHYNRFSWEKVSCRSISFDNVDLRNPVGVFLYLIYRKIACFRIIDFFRIKSQDVQFPQNV